MTTSAPLLGSALRFRACRIVAPRPRTFDQSTREPLKTATVWPSYGAVASPANRTLPGNCRAGGADQGLSALPKCPPSGGHKNPRKRACRECYSRRPRAGCGRQSHVFLPFGLLLPVAWLDTYGHRRHVGPWMPKNFPLPVFPRKRGLQPAFLAHARGAKIRSPAGAQRCACPPLASGGSGSVSSSRP